MLQPALILSYHTLNFIALDNSSLGGLTISQNVVEVADHLQAMGGTHYITITSKCHSVHIHIHSAVARKVVNLGFSEESKLSKKQFIWPFLHITIMRSLLLYWFALSSGVIKFGLARKLLKVRQFCFMMLQNSKCLIDSLTCDQFSSFVIISVVISAVYAVGMLSTEL